MSAIHIAREMENNTFSLICSIDLFIYIYIYIYYIYITQLSPYISKGLFYYIQGSVFSDVLLFAHDQFETTVKLTHTVINLMIETGLTKFWKKVVPLCDCVGPKVVACWNVQYYIFLESLETQLSENI